MLFGFLALGLAALFLLSGEAGFRVGRRAAARGVPKAFDHAMNWQTAMLGLSALLIGFTFAMAVARYDSRKQVLAAEANAIGTTYLRTQLLDEPGGKDIRQLLQRYVDQRLALYGAGIDKARIAENERATQALQGEIWSRVVAVGRADPRSITAGLVLQSANDMFDRAEDRRDAREMPVPPEVFVVVILSAAIAMASIGYTCAIGGRRMSFGMIVLPLLVTGVIMLVLDIAHPSLGVVRVPDFAMLHLKQTL